MMTSEEYKAAARRLRLDATILSRLLGAGQFRSLRMGVHGVDFAGVREYTPFDDARLIDWNVTARSNKTYVKLFEEDRDCQIFIILDDSLSMLTGSGRTRLDAGADIARLLCMAADMRGIRVGGVIFNDEVCTLVPPNTKGIFIQKMSKFNQNIPNGTALDIALTATFSLLKMRSFVMVISDFRCAASLYEKPLTALARKHDVAAICVTDKMDTDLPDMGSVRFTDAEHTSFLPNCGNGSNGSIMLPTSSASFSIRWKRAGQDRITLWKQMCAKRGAASAIFSTADNALDCLLGVFERKGRHR